MNTTGNDSGISNTVSLSRQDGDRTSSSTNDNDSLEDVLYTSEDEDEGSEFSEDLDPSLDTFVTRPEAEVKEGEVKVADDDDKNGDGDDDVHDVDKKAKYFLLPLLGLVEYLCGIALSILAPFYTSEAASHGLSMTASGIVFATVFILQIVFTPIFGKYISKFGAITLLVSGSVCSGVANIGFGCVSEIKSVEAFFSISILMRAVTALGESAINTSVYPLARGLTPSKYTNTVISCIETAFGLGTMTGPFFGGLLYEKGGFFLPFAVCGSLLGVSGLVCGMMLVCLRRRERSRQAKRLEAVEDGVQEEELIVPKRIKFREVMKNPEVLLASFIVALSGVSTQWYQPILEPFLSTNYSISAFQASMFLVIDGAVYAVVAPLWGYLLDRALNARLVLMFGCATISGSFLLLGPIYFPYKETLAQVGISLGIHGIGMAANFIGTLTILIREIEKRNINNKENACAIATSLWITAECVGSFLGSTLGGLAYETWGWDMSCLIISLVQLAGLVVLLFSGLYQRLEVGERSGERKPLLDKQTSQYGSNNNIRAI